jgi:4-hydroxy-tetrahydrodipicolinate synthase
VVVGATAQATDSCVAYARDAVSRGAGGLLVAPPRMARPSEAAVRRHYETLAGAVDVPIVVQDFPTSSGVFMTPAFIASAGPWTMPLRGGRTRTSTGLRSRSWMPSSSI